MNDSAVYHGKEGVWKWPIQGMGYVIYWKIDEYDADE
jgi:hypothetical protein